MFLRIVPGFEKSGWKKWLILSFCLLSSFFFIGSAIAAGHGEFKAEGKRGWVKFFGNSGYVEVEGKGKLWVTTGRDSRAEMSGTFKEQEQQGETVYYKVFDGKIKITGMNFSVDLRGDNIKYSAVGKGKVALRGIGTYSTDNEPSKPWGKDYKWAHCRF